MNNEKKRPSFFMIVLVLFLYLSYINKDFILSFFRTLYECLIPFFYSVVIVYLLNPVIKTVARFLQRYTKLKDKMVKTIAVITAYVLLLVLGYYAVMSVIPIVQSNVINFFEHFSDTVKTIMSNIDSFGKYVKFQDIQQLEDVLNQYIDNFITTDTISSILPYLYNTTSYVFNFTYNIAVAFIISLYLVFETDALMFSIKKLFRAIFGQRSYNICSVIARDSYNMFNTYMLGKIKDSCIVGILLFITMQLIGLDYPVLLSIIVTVTNMIPYIGPFIGGAIGMVILLTVSWEDALIFFVIILILQQLDCWVIGVIVIEKETNMSPLLILMSVIIGGALFGWVGMLIGTPVAGIIVYIARLMIQAEEMKHGYDDSNL